MAGANKYDEIRSFQISQKEGLLIFSFNETETLTNFTINKVIIGLCITI